MTHGGSIMTKKSKSVTAGALVLAAVLVCGTTTSALAASQAYCDAQARDYANAYTNTGGNIVGGAVSGAIGGAVLGGIFGGKNKIGRGAAYGAGAGAAVGAVGSAGTWQQNYNYAYRNCRGTAQPAYRAVGGPPPGTEEWYDYCADRYRSFNPDTGMFLSNSGYWKPCR
jgi:hypothetical protein